MVFSVFVYAYRASLGVSERQPNPKFTLARADRLQTGMSPLSIISLWGEYDYSIVKLFENIDESLDSLLNQNETSLKRSNKS